MRRAWLILLLVGACAALVGCGGSWSQSTAAGNEPADESAPPAPMQAANGPVDDPPLVTPLRLRLAGARNAFPDPFRKPPRAALVFDLDSGEVLWRKAATRDLPIASLTKIMTALLVNAHAPASARVRITKQALAYQGSGVGLLPKHRTVQLETMLYGLMLASGNDAAIALAQHVSGTVPRFVARMNSQARALGLRCTRFDSPSGFEEVRFQRQAANRSCAADLAVLARALLDQPRLARIVRTRVANRPFPVKGGRIQLYNHNPLLKERYPGTLGIKTGYTDVAGRSLVAAVERDVHGKRRRLGVVLLHSPDPGRQAKALLSRSFAALAGG
ncbi:D-alanyl-D-alanine carboxypeptidase family protein [Patulibacter defluvii]|uniref:D-alanyl-D-alanine carboxypeptidase family protein n=1 Tax=Patulibacter defluvii TaxID=3095358 RepID=UPI002A75F9DE|nr:serine hydrolase [Patulibacter sp. DM4]